MRKELYKVSLVKSIKELFHQFKIMKYIKKIYRKNLIQDSRYVYIKNDPIIFSKK